MTLRTLSCFLGHKYKTARYSGKLDVSTRLDPDFKRVCGVLVYSRCERCGHELCEWITSRGNIELDPYLAKTDLGLPLDTDLLNYKQPV